MLGRGKGHGEAREPASRRKKGQPAPRVGQRQARAHDVELSDEDKGDDDEPDPRASLSEESSERQLLYTLALSAPRCSEAEMGEADAD